MMNLIFVIVCAVSKWKSAPVPEYKLCSAARLWYKLKCRLDSKVDQHNVPSTRLNKAKGSDQHLVVSDWCTSVSALWSLCGRRMKNRIERGEQHLNISF